METEECTLNVVSEHFIEAVNACSVDAPRGVSEWTLSGLHQAPSTTVKPARVQESIFSIEAKLVEVVDFKTSRSSVKPHGCLAIIEATRFWVREDAIDAKQGHIDLKVLRPVAQLGGMSYGRITQTFELPRISWANVMKEAGPQLEHLIGQKVEAE
jgi:flavin reductase (DIM6/NTAB) family NADH-FMN oxidoreductase RutF